MKLSSECKNALLKNTLLKKTLSRHPLGSVAADIRKALIIAAAGIGSIGGTSATWAQAVSAQSQMKAYAEAAKSTPSASRGQAFFTAQHGGEWSCATCHGTPPTGTGKHASTSKPITPLAPAFNPERFTDAAKTEKWFRRNCKDVLKRECSPAEKADVLAYLTSLQK